MAGWTKTSGVSGTTTGATLLLGSIAAGQFIRVTVMVGAASTTTTCADNQDGSYTLSKRQPNSSDGSECFEFMLYPTVNTASRTVTVTASAGTVRIVASWFTPPTSTTGVAVSTSNGADGTGGAVSSGNVTALLGDLVAGAATNANNFGSADWTAGGTSAGGSWATDQDFNDGGNHVVYSQYVVATAGGTFTSAPTYSGTDFIASAAIIYHATTGGAAFIAAPIGRQMQAVKTAAGF